MASTHRPAGPGGHFLLGCIPQLMAAPHTFLLETAIEYGDIAFFRLGTNPVYLVSNPDAIQEILVSGRELYIKGKLDIQILSKFLGNGILTSDGEYHRRQRKMVQPAFHAKRIEAYAQTMVDYTLRLLEGWQDGADRDIHKDMMQVTMEIVAKTLFDSAVTEYSYAVGHAVEDLQVISHSEFRMGINIPQWLPIPRNRRRKAAKQVLDRVVMGFIEERRTDPRDKGDLLSMLLLSADDEGRRMTDQEVRDEAVTLFAAGHETTSNALSWTWYLLSQHPHVVEKLHAELQTVLAGRAPTLKDLRRLPYTHQILKESMRLYPPAWNLTSRRPTKDTQLLGYDIPAESIILIAPYVVHRLPTLWDEPNHFDPERFQPEREKQLHRYAYFPFGGGHRVCIGNSFAMMEAALVLATIAQRYDLELLPDPVVEPEPMITMMPKYGLRMRLHQRQKQAIGQKIQAATLP